MKDQVGNVLSEAVQATVQPAVQTMSEQAAKQAVEFARREGPRLMKEQILPPVMKSVGAETPGDLAKAGVAKVGETLSSAGGLTGIAGKLMSKLGGGKGGGEATGYGQKRRMPIQQDIFVSVPLEDVYRAWTEYKRWTEFMHRANQVDPQIEEGDQEGETKGAVRLTVTEKMWGFKRPFTAEVVSQAPNEHILWKSTQGTKHVGLIAFHGIAPRLTLISVNIDHAPSGPIEKIARGARFDKRAIRADLHRFKGWVEHKNPDEIAEMEGWLGTIEGGQITKPHEPAGEADDKRENEDEVAEPLEEEDTEGSNRGLSGEDEQEEPQGGQEGDEEDAEDDQAEDEGVEEDEEDLEDMGKNDLIRLARERGLTIRGNREDLIRRLREDEEEEEEEEEPVDEEEEEPEERPMPGPRTRARRARNRVSPR